MIRLLLILCSLVALTALPACAEDVDERAQEYLKSVTAEIRSRMTAVKVEGSGVATDVSFNISKAGGAPSGIYFTDHSNSQWEDFVKKTLKACTFAPFQVGEEDELRIDARISYFPNSDKPQPGIIFREAKYDKNIPLFRTGGVLFYSALFICAIVCVFVQGLIILIGGFSLTKQWILNLKK
jgi:hypothetical protein